MQIIISQVEENSIAQELGLCCGDEIISINQVTPRDILDYSFLVKDEEIELHIKKKNGEEEIFEIEKDYDDTLGISFESAVFDRVKPCTNHCIFCFVDQQPKGLRDTLYIKDDDWRLSYLQGTYVTLTNMKEADWGRLEQFHPEPLYVSVHTTNPELRAKMLRNPNAGNIIKDLERLKKNDIKIHTQVVLCPDYNDGDELLRTLEDLKKFKKILNSVAIVPVGVSKFRKEEIKMVDKTIAEFVIKAVEEFNLSMKKNIAMASDEFFLIAGREIPDKKYYGKFCQIEDGVGSIRLLCDDFEKCKKKLKKSIKNKTKVSILTGASVAWLFRKFAKEIDVKNLEFEVVEVKNKFFGEKINVTGLIVGQDVEETLAKNNIQNVIIPSVMLKEGSEEFLDGMSVDDLRQKFPEINFYIVKNCYGFSEVKDIINSF